MAINKTRKILYYRLLKKVLSASLEAFIEVGIRLSYESLFGSSAKPSGPTGYKAPETGNHPKGGTERCLLREEIPRNEAYVEVRCNDEE